MLRPSPLRLRTNLLFIFGIFFIANFASAAEDKPKAPSTPDVIEEELGDLAAEQAPPAEPPYPNPEDKEFKTAQASATSTPFQTTERPMQITDNGEYIYATDKSPQASASSVRIGFFAPPDIYNLRNNAHFEDIYGAADVPVVFFDYEWQALRGFGRLGLKAGSGIFGRNGNGKFVTSTGSTSTPAATTKQTPDEKFTFIMFPTTVSAIYRFQWADSQALVPFIEGGAGYFTFAEIRDDNKPPIFGGAGAAVAAAGASFLLDWLDKHAIQQLDKDFGINHVWFTAEYRQVIGFSKKYDMTARVINAGVTMEF